MPSRPLEAATRRGLGTGPAAAAANGSTAIDAVRFTGDGVALEAAEEKNESGPSSWFVGGVAVPAAGDSETGARKLGCRGSAAMRPVKPTG